MQIITLLLKVTLKKCHNHACESDWCNKGHLGNRYDVFR